MTEDQKHGKVGTSFIKKHIKTMPKIRPLSPLEAQKIAAGQVVERAANVIKELLENAIDAQATHISIFIENGGNKRIRVIDNGCGMDPQDAQLCFQKHATSKITSIDELLTLTSFGFRGEALASIAAIASVNMRTKPQDTLEGSQVTVQEGIISISPISCPQGTDITVENLFFNVPARAKFIKKRETELRHIMQTIKAICFAYPQLHIEFFVENKQLLNCPAQEDIMGRYAQLWDAATTQHMISIDATHTAKGISLSGAISTHQWSRYDRSGIFFLVNNRWVTNQHLMRALLKGYNNVIPHGHYPMATIALFINPALIDINCHPRKEEIIFANPRIVEQLIQDTMRNALEKNLSRQIKKDVTIFQTTPYQSTSAAFTPALSTRFQATLLESSESIQPPSLQPIFQASSMPLDTHPLSILEKEESTAYTIIGQYHKTYILLETEDGLSLIDQHAAHERILYELFSNRFEKIPTINLMFPQLITCATQDIAIIEPYLSLLADHGITIEPFGKDQLIIQSTPVHLKNEPLKEMIMDVIGWIKECNGINAAELHITLHNKLQAQMACKASVKAGDSLTIEQMQELIDDLHKTTNRFSCPHGRPTGWLISIADIERKFQRRK
jgi:DNA mismatch repair protein MutL